MATKSNEALAPFMTVTTENTIASDSITRKVPKILDGVISLVKKDFKTIEKDCGPEDHNDFKGVLQRIKAIKQEINDNAVMRPINDYYPDYMVWNYYLQERAKADNGKESTYHDVEMFYVECYIYRRLWEAFQLTYTMRVYDYFRPGKTEALLASTSTIVEMCNHLEQIRPELKEKPKDDYFDHFVDFAEISVWGNQFDMAQHAGEVTAPTHQDPLANIRSLRSNILTNDLPAIWKLLNNKGPRGKKKVGIIMDNAGMELFSDLLFLDFLATIAVVKQVTFFIKSYPWFVSDATKQDLKFTLKTLIGMEQFSCNRLGAKCQHRFKTREWKIETNAYWMTPFAYNEMPKRDPDLYKKLSGFDLLIFKGDLNSRKLIGERLWDITTPLEKAVGDFRPTNLCFFRVIKCQVAAGLPEKANKLTDEDPKWFTKGEYGQISLVKAK